MGQGLSSTLLIPVKPHQDLKMEIFPLGSVNQKAPARILALPLISWGRWKKYLNLLVPWCVLICLMGSIILLMPQHCCEN